MLFKHRLRQRYEYQHLKESDLEVTEVGRHYGSHEVDIETWSVKSGTPIPFSCQIPNMKEPSKLPLSLHIDRWFEDMKAESCVTTGSFNRLNADRHHNDVHFSVRDILNWSNRENFKLSGVDHVMNCSVLRTISLTPCQRQSAWEFALYFYQQKLFIDISLPKVLDKPREEHEDTFGRWGKKFEDIMRHGDYPNLLYNGEDIDVRVNRIVTIGSHKILTTAKVSCQSSDGPQDTLGNYIGLKTHNELQGLNQQKAFYKYKSQKVWAHSALLGLQTVYFGLRTKEGELLRIQKNTVDELAYLGRASWMPKQIISFLDELLAWVSDTAVDGLTYTLRYKAEDVIELCWADHAELRNIVQEQYPNDHKTLSGS